MNVGLQDSGRKRTTIERGTARKYDTALDATSTAAFEGSDADCYTKNILGRADASLDVLWQRSR
jgi:hypothetical protein